MKELKETLTGFNLVLSNVADLLCGKPPASKIVQGLIMVLHALVVATMECSAFLVEVIEGVEEEK